MKSILINGLLLTGRYGGVQYSIEYLINALSKTEFEGFKVTILVSKNYDGLLKGCANFEIRRVPFDSKNRMIRVLYEHFILPVYILRSRFDLFHSPAYTLPFFSRKPSIVTIHDLIALQFPELCQNETSIYFSTTLARSLK
ncbi:MAG: hypothetical protein EOO43_18255, partial [Flavobacterium sp.]